MSKATERKVGATGGSDRQPDLNVLMDANGAYFDAALKSSEALFRGMAALQQEIVQLASQRLQEGFEMSRSLAGCSDPSQAFGMQCDAARKATEQFLAETGKLMTLSAQIAGDCLEPLQDRAKETLSRLARR